MANKPQRDYNGEEFLKQIEDFARKGYTDKEIALEIGLHPSTFSEHKNVTYPAINEALTRGRAKINNIVRQRFLALGLGGIKTKRTSRKIIEGIDGDDSQVVYEEETELAPNLSALSTWLYNHDEEWREKVNEGKRLDVTSKGEKVNAEPLIFVSASELSEDDLNGLIKKQLGDD